MHVVACHASCCWCCRGLVKCASWVHAYLRQRPKQSTASPATPTWSAENSLPSDSLAVSQGCAAQHSTAHHGTHEHNQVLVGLSNLGHLRAAGDDARHNSMPAMSPKGRKYSSAAQSHVTCKPVRDHSLHCTVVSAHPYYNHGHVPCVRRTLLRFSLA